MPTLRLAVPADYYLRRDVCSYGYFLLAPNRWDVQDQCLTRPFRLPGRVVVAQITQPKGRGTPLRLALSHTTDRPARANLLAQVTRMLRLDEPQERLAEFHRADPRWKRSGRGRLFRSPTLFEDIIKTVTSCNVTWPNTVNMNLRLCEVMGDSATGSTHRTFPTPAKLARARPQTLRARCRVGYRDARIIQLGRLLRAGAIDPATLEDPATPDDFVYETLLDLPGIGPYAAANILQLLGRYSRLPLDTESVRHGRTVLAMRGTPAQVMKQVHAHFAPFGHHAFRSYWFEMWEFYESKHGKAWTWERDSTGKLFTAAQLNKVATPARRTNPAKAPS